MQNGTLHYVSSKTCIHMDRTTSFSHELRLDPSHNRISLISCSFPKVSYTVDTPSNRFALDATVFELPIGCYSARELCVELCLLVAVPGFATLNARLGMIAFTHPTAATLSFPADSLLHNLMGFEAGSVNSFVGGTLLSTNIIELQPVSLVHVTCSVVEDGSGAVYDNLLQCFPVNDHGDFAWVNHVNPDVEATSKRLVRQNQTGLAIVPVWFAFYDEDSRLLNLRGLPVFLQVRTWAHHDLHADLVLLQKQLRAFVDYVIQRDKYERMRQPLFGPPLPSGQTSTITNPPL